MHRVIWWVVGIIILLFVFALGVKVGELRVELRNAFNNYYNGYPMMQRAYNGGGVMVPVTGATQGSATGTTSNGLMIPAQQ